MEPLALLLLALGLQLDLADAGGHGKKHHDHLNIHVPKFIHHDFHTKVITIHHHHHKPKKQHHHHHHHHHHKPHHHVPHHHYHHKKHTTLKTTSVSKGSHGHHGHHHGHHHHGHHGHHGHHHGHHHHDTGYQDQPVYQHVPYSGHHDPTHDISTDYVPPSYDDHFESSYTPLSPSSVPSFDTDIPQPRIRGYTHTVKQTKVFGSDPHNLPQGHAAPVSGYEVTEAVADDEDSFSSLNSLQQSFPASYGLVRNLAPEMSQGEAFPAVPAASPAALTVPVQAHDPFAESPVEAPQLPSSFAPATADTSGFDDAESFVGSGPGSAFAADEDRGSGDSPVSFAREGGLSQTYHTSGQQTIVY